MSTQVQGKLSKKANLGLFGGLCSLFPPDIFYSFPSKIGLQTYSIKNSVAISSLTKIAAGAAASTASEAPPERPPNAISDDLFAH